MHVTLPTHDVRRKIHVRPMDSFLARGGFFDDCVKQHQTKAVVTMWLKGLIKKGRVYRELPAPDYNARNILKHARRQVAKNGGRVSTAIINSAREFVEFTVLKPYQIAAVQKLDRTLGAR